MGLHVVRAKILEREELLVRKQLRRVELLEPRLYRRQLLGRDELLCPVSAPRRVVAKWSTLEGLWLEVFRDWAKNKSAVM